MISIFADFIDYYRFIDYRNIFGFDELLNSKCLLTFRCKCYYYYYYCWLLNLPCVCDDCFAYVNNCTQRNGSWYVYYYITMEKTHGLAIHIYKYKHHWIRNFVGPNLDMVFAYVNTHWLTIEFDLRKNCWLKIDIALISSV